MKNENSYKKIAEDLFLALEMMPTAMLSGDDDAEDKLEEIGHELLKILNAAGEAMIDMDSSFCERTQGYKLLKNVMKKTMENFVASIFEDDVRDKAFDS